jgi:pyridoxamine 5'-phosphate oxidase
MNLAELRASYRRGTLDLTDLAADPHDQFATWFEQAQRADVPEPNAMTLATATADGEPAARIVLLKGVGPDGFVFFTDYRSPKGRALTENPRAALCFHWHQLERQVRVTGGVRLLDRAAAAAYFHSRPRGSQVGAWVSVQSAPLASRADLDAAVEQATARYAAGEIPLPPHWGGVVVEARTIEFWQGRPDRLHDRFLYTRTESGWRCDRLSP